MRILVLATTVLLATSSLYAAFAQGEGKKAQDTAPQAVPAQTNQNAPAQQDQRTGSDQPKADNREVGRDWRAYPSDMGRMMDRMGRGVDWDHRKVGRDWQMRRDDDEGDRDRDRGYRGSDRGDRDGYGRGYHDEDRPRRRVKVCFEYENGDEYCRYRE
jgi:hypothetical protein